MSEAPVPVSHALCIYAEPLAARRRVVVVGDASLGLDARLVDLGARTVHVFDPDAARAREHAKSAPRGVIVRELPAGDFDVREGAFDLAIVPDLAAIEDRAGLLVRLRKLVGPEGAALVAAKSAPPGDATGLDYYEMYDLVALQFANVRMIGQVPFTGVALAELGEQDEEPVVSVDTQLVGAGPAPEVFIALAAQFDVRLEAYSIVQVPQGAPSPADTRPDTGGASEHAELASATLRGELLQSQLEEQRAMVTQLRVEAERGARVDELEAALAERTAKLKDAETRAGDHYVRAERGGHEVRRLEEELQRQRDRATRLTKEIEEEKRLRTRAEGDLGQIRKSPDLPQARGRISLLEDGLRAAEDATAILQARAIEAEATIAQREDQLGVVATVLAQREAQLAAVAEVATQREAQVAALAAEVALARAAEGVRAAELEQVRASEAQLAREIAAAPRIAPEQLHALALRAELAEARAAMVEAQVHELAETQGAELAELESILRQRAQAIKAIEHELVRREALVRELVAALEDAGMTADVAVIGDQPTERSPAHAQLAATEAIDELRGHLRRAIDENADLRSKLDTLALEVARREGEMQARAWRISELEERVASLESREVAPAPIPPPPASVPRVAPVAQSTAPERPVPLETSERGSREADALRAEMSVLRQAFAQEHESRVRAESGEELTRARADLARQAALLEQLAGELESRPLARERQEDPPADPGQAPGPAQT